MVTERIKHNAHDIERELGWFRKILKTRSLINANKESEYADIFEITPPDFSLNGSDYATFVTGHSLNFEERFLLILAMVPHIKPELLDIFLARNETTQQIFTEFGGKKGKTHSGFLPTGETALFILAGSNMERRFSMYRLFEGTHVFSTENIVTLEDVDNDEPFLSGALTISREALDRFTTGQVRKPNFSAVFPAKLLTTEMEWDDLVLSPGTKSHISEIDVWLNHNHTLLNGWEMGKKLKPGYRVLFYGPPGTGKSLTAALIGNKTGKDVYRIDLSKVVSKYIGETEKNLSRVFDRAENKDWILFFDEADALFGKRTSIQDAHDRYANQEVSYLLQRIEDYNGLIILASNLKSNLDDAFIRRFQSIVPFQMPRLEDRLILWQKGFSHASKLEERIDLQKIAGSYELAGGSIINIIQYSSLMALKNDSNIIRLKDITEGIKKEYHKAGRTI